MWVEMDELLGNCSVLCSIECTNVVKKWYGSDCDNRGYQGHRSWFFKLGTPSDSGSVSAQEWRNRTLISHELLVCSKMCFSKTEPIQ